MAPKKAVKAKAAAIEPNAEIEQDDGTRASKIVNFRCEILVKKDENVKLRTMFRYIFVDGTKTSTKVATAEDWSVVQDEENSEKCTQLKFEQMYGRVKIDENFALKLNEQPGILFTIGNESGKKITGLLEVDVSPFLAGDVKLEFFWGDGYAKPPVGFSEVKITISSDQKLLTQMLEQSLNPFSICVNSASKIPGLNASGKAQQQYLLPTSYSLQQKYCKPTYVSFVWLDELGIHRRAKSLEFTQSNKTKFEYKTVYLLGHLDAVKLLEVLSNVTLRVEFHDRDINNFDALTAHFSEMLMTESDFFEASKLFYNHVLKTDREAGDQFAHGVATVRLAEFAMKSSHKNIKAKFTSSITPQKRRTMPKGAAGDDTLLSTEERFVRSPGSYLEYESKLSMIAILNHAISKEQVSDLKNPCFGRMACVIKYNNISFLQTLQNEMDNVNSLALPGNSLRSYQLSEEETQFANDGTLDIITGFTVIDQFHRIIIVEGIASKGLARLSACISRTAENSMDYKILMNPEVQFSTRLYACYHVDLKKIKLRDPLPELLKMPEIYMRSKVSMNCFSAIQMLRDIRKAQDLRELESLNLFPLPHMLQEVESKYGESITMRDIDGSENLSASKTRRRNSETLPETTVLEKTPREVVVHEKQRRLKAATDSFNPLYLKAKEERREKNYLKESKIIQQEIQKAVQEKLALERENMDDAPVYMYSGQKLQNTELNKAAMRDRLAKDVSANFTYSSEFQSLAMCMVDEDKIICDEHEASRKKWTTPSGFMYPAPRDPSEYIKHPNAPSKQRQEELREPWVENANHPKPISREGSDSSNKFNTLPSKDMVFGGTNSDGTVNATFFKSVHLVGDGMEAEMDAARELEQKTWNDKLVVDKNNLRFIAHGSVRGLGKSKPSQLDRRKEMLDGAPKSKPIRIVRNAKLPSGKKVLLEAPPITIMAQDEYVEPSAYANSMRKSEPSQWSGKKDFLLQLPITSKRVNSKTIIKPLHDNEKQGTRWRTE